MNEIAKFPFEEIEEIEEIPSLKTGSYEDLPASAKEDAVLGSFFDKDWNFNRDTENIGMVAIRERTFGFSLERRYQKQVKGKINMAAAMMHREGRDTESAAFQQQEVKLDYFHNLYATNSQLRETVKEAVAKHEHMHADQAFRFPQLEELQKLSIWHNRNSENKTTEGFRVQALGANTMIEAQSYLAMLRDKEGKLTDTEIEAILNTFIMDKACYVFLPGFSRRFENAQSGRVENVEENIFGSLVAITGDVDLLDKIQGGSLSIEDLQETVLTNLRNAMDNPSEYAAKITSKDFLKNIDKKINGFLGGAVEESKKLNMRIHTT